MSAIVDIVGREILDARGKRTVECDVLQESGTMGRAAVPAGDPTGGAHANNNLDLQELMIIPVGAPTFREAMRYGAEVFHALKKIINDRGMSVAVGDEGGFAPNVENHEAAISMILEAIEKAGYRPGEQIALGLDCASSEFYKDGRYNVEAEGLVLDAGEWANILESWTTKYPIVSIEDGMAEGDWDGWKLLNDKL